MRNAVWFNNLLKRISISLPNYKEEEANKMVNEPFEEEPRQLAKITG